MNDYAKRAALAAMLLISLFLLSGCFGQIAERPMTDISQDVIDPGVSAPAADGTDAHTFYAALYFMNEDASALVPVTRLVSVQRGQSDEEAALHALLGGPLEDEDAYYPELEGMKSERFLEISGGIATVDLPAGARTLDPQTLCALRQSICNTLTEFGDIAYVNVLIGGREEGFDLGATMPAGTFSRLETLDVGTFYSRMDEQRLSGRGVPMTATLYFPSADGSMILPQARSVTLEHVSPIDCLYTMLQELGSAAEHALCAKDVPPPMEYIDEMPEIIRTEDGYLAVDLQLGGGIDAALEDAGLTRGVYLAMLTDTLMGFVPGVEGLRVSIGGVHVASLRAEQTPNGETVHFEHGLCIREDFSGYVGAPVTLYALDEEIGALVALDRVIAQTDARSARARLIALMQLEGDAVFALPHGLMPADILAVHQGADVISVNLSHAFADALSKLTHEQERAAVYAMINTLTEGSEAARVVFFFEGEQIQELAGALEMRGSFMRNPGMVVSGNGSVDIF